MHRYRFLRSPVHYPWPATGHFPPRRRETFAVCEGENIKSPDTLKTRQRVLRVGIRRRLKFVGPDRRSLCDPRNLRSRGCVRILDLGIAREGAPVLSSRRRRLLFDERSRREASHIIGARAFYSARMKGWLIYGPSRKYAAYNFSETTGTMTHPQHEWYINALITSALRPRG